MKYRPNVYHAPDAAPLRPRRPAPGRAVQAAARHAGEVSPREIYQRRLEKARKRWVKLCWLLGDRPSEREAERQAILAATGRAALAEERWHLRHVLLPLLRKLAAKNKPLRNAERVLDLFSKLQSLEHDLSLATTPERKRC